MFQMFISGPWRIRSILREEFFAEFNLAIHREKFFYVQKSNFSIAFSDIGIQSFREKKIEFRGI